ncbi:hypothetical protein CLV96_3785 [Leptospira meyeri]|uniref:Uncharacterized protein n=1 Tax=Leptospira meyeri TaxID=29508 RepID=A0A4R8MP47_LEPME|nr:hypothetical protein [Leptospira meyeri]EKJ88106.1 hypothetical protein LEP1GSC017_0918 [Leptospira meyeri serovar Hardjo str. Went 5]TDY67364.1 hypothetical protein CLV96_3785 [Leptospira meyeri]
MFGFYLTFFWILISFFSANFSWPTGLIAPLQFLFWWNLVFSSFWLLLIFIVVFGLLGFLLRIPVVGILLQGIRNQITEIGWYHFLINRTTVWLLSQTLILSGSFVFGYGGHSETWIYTLSLSVTIFGYFIKQNFYKPMASFSGSKGIFVYQSGGIPRRSNPNQTPFPEEKDVTPP